MLFAFDSHFAEGFYLITTVVLLFLEGEREAQESV